MKKIHYCLIGLPKTGTSALFEYLKQHPEVDYAGIKENYNFSHFDWSLNQYKNYYKKYNVSLSISPGQWCMDSDQIAELSEVVTHASISLRNPWDFASSLYTYTDAYKNQSASDYVDMMLETNHFDYAGIVSHWIKSCNRPFLVLYYDDLQQDHVAFYQQVTKFLGIREFLPQNNAYVNVSKKPRQTLSFTKEQTVRINSLIDSAQQYFKKNLEHWKRSV